MRCLVTGASGHIGNVLTRELDRHDYDISIFSLPNEDLSIFSDLDLTVCFGNITDQDAVCDAVSTCDVVFHLAGIIDIGTGNKKRMHEINVGGTNHVIAACGKYQKPLIYIGSVHAIPELPKGNTITETRNFDPQLVVGTYAKTKAEASRNVMKFIETGGQAIIVEPSGVLGPYEYKLSNMGQMILECASGNLRAYIEGGYNFADVRDVAKGIRLAYEKGNFGETYILSGEVIQVKKIFDTVTQTCSIAEVRYRMPLWLAKGTAFFAEWFYKIQKKKPLFTPYSIYTLQTNSDFSHDKAAVELGYQARPIEESIRDMVHWFEQQNILECKK